MSNLTKKALGLGLAAFAVCSAFGASQFKETIASPRSVVTDALPPFGMLDENGTLIPVPKPSELPTAMLAMPSTESAKPRHVSGPSLDLATEAARAAVDACAKRGFKIAVAVVDAEGKPRVTLMAESSEGSVFVAMRKAAATLAFRLPSSAIGASIQRDKAMLARMTPVMFISGGALPIWREKELIGAIASSGAHGPGPIGTEDEICAQAGLDKIKKRLQ